MRTLCRFVYEHMPHDGTVQYTSTRIYHAYASHVPTAYADPACAILSILHAFGGVP